MNRRSFLVDAASYGVASTFGVRFGRMLGHNSRQSVPNGLDFIRIRQYSLEKCKVGLVRPDGCVVGPLLGIKSMMVSFINHETYGPVTRSELEVERHEAIATMIISGAAILDQGMHEISRSGFNCGAQTLLSGDTLVLRYTINLLER